MTSDRIWIEPDRLGREERFEIVEGGDRYSSGIPVNDEQGRALLVLLSERFPDWLGRVKREAAAEALEQAAQEARRIENGDPWIESGGEIVHCDDVRDDPSKWLRARAAEIREGK